MATFPVTVVVDPVSAVPDGQGDLFLAVYRPGDSPLRRRIEEGHPEDVARSLVVEDGPQLVRDLTEWQPRLEPVQFEVIDGELHLLYTVAVPLSAPLLSAKGKLREPAEYKADWTRLSDLDADADPLARHTREHWRQNLQETDVVLSLLPRYFTSPQARSIYESVWGKELDPGNFTKWLVKQNRMCRAVEDAEIRIPREVDAFAAAKLGHTLGVAGVSLARALPKSMVGVSPGIIAAGPLGGLVGAVAAGAVVAGAVAYQAKRQPGRQPVWYTGRRDSGDRRVLEHAYVPRPEWHR